MVDLYTTSGTSEACDFLPPLHFWADISSQGDGMIVAWHEVPGTTPPQKSRPVGYGMIRAGVRTDLKIRRGNFEKYLWDQLRQIIPYPTGRFFRRRFPGTSCLATISLSLRDKAIRSGRVSH